MFPINLSSINKILYVIVMLILCSCNRKPDDQTNGLLAITTTNASSITANSAVSGGVVTNDGVQPIIEKGICIATSASPTILNTKIASSDSSKTFTIKITGLLSNTTYYVRAYVLNNSGITYGNQISIQTLVSSVTTDSAVVIYVGSSSNKLFALNAKDGSLKWTATLGAHVYSSPIYSNGKVYVGCSDNKLYAFDTLGNFIWSVSAPNSYSNHQCPIVANNIVYFPGDDATYAFNASTGNLLWKFLGGSNNISIRNNIIYINNTFLYALDATTGLKIWQYLTNSSLPPVVFNDRIYVITHLPSLFPDSLNVLNTANGNLLWAVGNYGIFHDAIGLNVKNGNIYCVTQFNANTATSGLYGLNILDSAKGTVKYPSSHLQVMYTYSDNVSPILDDSLGFVTVYDGSNAFNLFSGEYKGSYGGDQGATIANHILYSNSSLRSVFIPDNGGGYYNVGTVTAYDFKNKVLVWSKQLINVDFTFSSPCVVTKSGNVYRGGVVSH